MGKPPGYSEPFVSPNIDREEDMAKTGASPRIAKGVFVAIVIALVVLFLLVGIGLHIPTGG
jgi:hypothetical protein